ncbi:hypothetical protein OROGR_002231 [Orobanche gracilis]
MAANGGRRPPPPPPPPFTIKKESGIDDDDDDDPKLENITDDDDREVDHRVGNISHDTKGNISIAERRAAKCGFNSARLNNAPTGLPSPQHDLQSSSPYVTIRPGISPSALLDSPVMVPNAQAQLSPTTGTFHQFQPSPIPESLLKLNLKPASHEGEGEEADHSTVIPTDSSSDSKPDSKSDPTDNFTVENLQPFVDSCFGCRTDYGHGMSKNDCKTLARTDYRCSNLELPVNTSSNRTFREITSSEDGFYWRKYGQKHVKGSEFPRSYYKCTNADCLVKKKVERSHAGEITQIVYKGTHNHPIPQLRLNGMRDGGGCLDGATSILDDFSHDDRHVSVGALCDHRMIDKAQEFSVSNSISNNHDSEDGVDDHNQSRPESCCELKKRKREDFPNETTLPRSGRESKVVVQIESDVDILDDGYRWRKYGQKVVKGNPNPRSYYKCTTPGCPVRKHVERAADDIKSVLTTYEGKHNHDVPSSKTGSPAMPDHVANHLSPVVANQSPTTQKRDHVSKAGKQVRDLLVPLYMERNPILHYNDLMRSNLPGNFSGHDIGGFGGLPPSSLYPYSFPPFPSISYNPLPTNGNNNHVNSYSSSSKFYPTLPLDNYMSALPSPAAVVPNIGGHFSLCNHYATLRQDQIPECQTANIIMKPKEEPTGDGSELYDTCMSTLNHGN